MAKGKDVHKKTDKTAPLKSPKEKREAKVAKKKVKENESKI